MNNQTQDYITLKPIAERFKEVASTITDEEIRKLIKDQLREQIDKQVNLGCVIAEQMGVMFEDDSWVEFIEKSIKDCITNRFK